MKNLVSALLAALLAASCATPTALNGMDEASYARYLADSRADAFDFSSAWVAENPTDADELLGLAGILDSVSEATLSTGASSYLRDEATKIGVSPALASAFSIFARRYTREIEVGEEAARFLEVLGAAADGIRDGAGSPPPEETGAEDQGA